MIIDKQGIYAGFDEAAYFLDPTPKPSFTQSLAKKLLAKSPLHAWYEHPRLNPDYVADDDRKFDVGNIAHAILIGRGKKIVVIEGFDDWRKKEAKDKRDEAAAAGNLGVLGKHYALADRMVKAAREQLLQRDLGQLFRDGDGEVVLAWEENGLWFRQMLDWLTPDRMTYADFKSTAESAAPHVLARKMVADGWPIQAAMAERGLDILDPDNAGRRRYLFIVQETEVPFALNVVEISEGPLTMGRKQLDYACAVWRECMTRNVFPGYPLEVQQPSYPGWAESEWLNREIIEAARERVPRKRELEISIMGAG